MKTFTEARKGSKEGVVNHGSRRAGLIHTDKKISLTTNGHEATRIRPKVLNRGLREGK